MTITVAGRVFDATKCAICGMRASDPADVERCEANHNAFDMFARSDYRRAYEIKRRGRKARHGGWIYR